jgi:hypothetical protein
MNLGMLAYFSGPDRMAEARRRDDEAWRELHRRPDALPLPVATPTERPARTSSRNVWRLVRQRLGT